MGKNTMSCKMGKAIATCASEQSGDCGAKRIYKRVGLLMGQKPKRLFVTRTKACFFFRRTLLLKAVACAGWLERIRRETSGFSVT